MNKEKGAILVILALVLTLLMLFVSLSIDTALLGSSHQKQARTAELGALGALETFLNSEDPSPIGRLIEAESRTREVVGFDLNNLVSQSDINQEKDTNLNPFVNSIGIGLSAVEVNSFFDRGVLIPGEYFFERPEDCFDASGSVTASYTRHDCPCVTSGECFRPVVNWSRQNVDNISAFKVVLYTDEDNPAGTIFADAAGAKKSFRLQSEAISTITPRHAVFLIDMSGSMTAETHSLSVENNLKSQYSFEVSSGTNTLVDCSSKPPVNYNDPEGCVRPRFEAPSYYSSFNPFSSLPGPAWGEILDNVLANRAWSHPSRMQSCRPNLIESSLKHYKSDYECLDLMNIDGSNISYLLETRYDSANNARIVNDRVGNYRGPEPLSSVLAAIHQALVAFETVTVPGDEVSFIAYDSNSPGIPSVNSNNVPIKDSAPRIIVRASPKTSDFCASNLADPYCELFRVTDMDDLTRDTILKRAELLLFPLIGANTDFSEALLRASEILTKSPLSNIADNMVVSFGDGLANCYHSIGATATPVDPTFNSSTPFIENTSLSGSSFVAAFSGEPGLCDPGGDKVVHDNAISEAVAIVSGEGRPLPGGFMSFVDSGIKFHNFMFGEIVQPHTVLRVGDKDSDGVADSCMTEADARASDLSYTDCAYDLNNPNDPNHPSNPANHPSNPNAVLGCSPLTFNSPSQSSTEEPYFAPNYNFQHQLSNPSGGRFLPIRRPCEIGDFAALPGGSALASIQDCLDGAGVDLLDSLCATPPGVATPGIGDVVRFTDAGGGTSTDAAGNVVNIPVMVDNGRLICDPLCRSKDTQAREAIDEIFSDNPLITVEPLPSNVSNPISN